VTRAASGIFSETGGEPAGLLAARLEIEAKNRSVGRPAAPDQLRGAVTEFEGVVRLRWKRHVRHCSFLIQMTRDPSAADGWKQVAISIRQSCEVTGFGERGKILASRGRQQRARPRPVESTGQRKGGVKSRTGFTGGTGWMR
jgi:hypothetical protein